MKTNKNWWTGIIHDNPYLKLYSLLLNQSNSQQPGRIPLRWAAFEHFILDVAPEFLQSYSMLDNSDISPCYTDREM